MSNFIKVHFYSNNRDEYYPALINKSQICYVTEEDGIATLYFSDNKVYTIKESYSSICSCLDDSE